jgi:cytochrome c5
MEFVRWNFLIFGFSGTWGTEPASDPAAIAKVPTRGALSVFRLNRHFSRESALFACLLGLFGLLILGAPSQGHTRIATALTAAQDAGQSAAPAAPAATPADSQAAPAPAVPAAPKPVVLPEGDGKPIATEFCQDCHKLTNLTRAHKDLDDWKDTIHTMMDRGARIPDEKIDTLAQYLFTNFGPNAASADTSASAASSAPASGSAAAAPSADASSGASAPVATAAKVELPDGDGKAIATENCQACHKLTNLTKAHKSLDDWKDTVQTMIDRGANVPPDKVDTLVQYLAKNFGPKDSSAPATPPPAN